jgi:hypothetical protein
VTEMKEYFYVCEYFEEGRRIGQAVSGRNEFEEEIGANKSTDEGAPRIVDYKNTSEFSRSFGTFVQSMLGYFEFVYLIAGLASILSKDILNSFSEKV